MVLFGAADAAETVVAARGANTIGAAVAKDVRAAIYDAGTLGNAKERGSKRDSVMLYGPACGVDPTGTTAEE